MARRPGSLPSLVVLLAVLLGCTPARPASSVTPPPTAPVATPALSGAETPPAGTASPQTKVEVVAQGLEVPWALAFAPDGRLFLTERPGRLRVIVDGELAPEPVAVLPVATSAESGLMGLALSPTFERDGWLYVMYTYRGEGGLRNRVSRLTLRGDQASEEHVLLEDIPGANIHDGGRIKFGPDGKLYITTGDASAAAQAQDLDSLAGKVLRLNADGSVPADNPLPSSPVYTYGHRNPQGLAWHPDTGDLFAVEHGPTGNDEVNVLVAGQNYGWPTVQGQAGRPPFVDPILTFSPSVAPAGATFYQGHLLEAWNGNLFFTTLRGRHLHRVVLGGADSQTVVTHERLLSDAYGRLRDVAEGPDGALYVTTSNRDGRASPAPTDDRVLRIGPGG